jgi:hypothetical protein
MMNFKLDTLENEVKVHVFLWKWSEVMEEVECSLEVHIDKLRKCNMYMDEVIAR